MAERSRGATSRSRKKRPIRQGGNKSRASSRAKASFLKETGNRFPKPAKVASKGLPRVVGGALLKVGGVALNTLGVAGSGLVGFAAGSALNKQVEKATGTSISTRIVDQILKESDRKALSTPKSAGAKVKVRRKTSNTAAFDKALDLPVPTKMDFIPPPTFNKGKSTSNVSTSTPKPDRTNISREDKRFTPSTTQDGFTKLKAKVPETLPTVDLGKERARVKAEVKRIMDPVEKVRPLNPKRKKRSVNRTGPAGRRF